MNNTKPKKKSKYHELDNLEEVDSIDLSPPNPVFLGKVLRKHSANSFPSIKEASTDIKDFPFNHCSSSKLRKSKYKDMKNMKKTRSVSFSPKTYKKQLSTDNKALETAITKLISLLEGGYKEENQPEIEKALINELNIGFNPNLNSEEMFLRLKKLLELLQCVDNEKRSENCEALKEGILNVLERNFKKDVVLMITSDSVNEVKEENNENSRALRESFHEFSLKKLMKMSFVENRKGLSKFKPLSVETNSIKMNVLNKSGNREEEDNLWEALKENIGLICCSIIITSFIFFIILI